MKLQITDETGLFKDKSSINQRLCENTKKFTSNISSHEISLGYEDKNMVASLNINTGVKLKRRTQIPDMQASNSGFNFKNNVEARNVFRKSISENMQRYEKKWSDFRLLYLNWKKERQSTIQKLKELKEVVHKDQLEFNKTNVMFKEMNVGSREFKNANRSPTLDFFASLATFLTDAAGGITSMAQAVNVDGYTNSFKEIMENDAEATKPIYVARSQCLEQYRGVEETVRRFHAETFGSTMKNISRALNMDELWLDIKDAQEENSTWKCIDSVDSFIQRNSNMTALESICNSFQDYTNSNPAVLEACKSTGKALYDAYDTWGRDTRQGRSSVSGNMSIIANTVMMNKERNELHQLRSIADDEEESQAKLETDVEDAIYSLQAEMREISNIFEEHW